RRRRGAGHDYCIVKLGLPGVVKGLDLDTTHFTGNYPPSASIDACASAADAPGADAKWDEIHGSVTLLGDAHNYLTIQSERRYTHLRINIYPDGGIARLRVYGQVQRDWDNVGPDQRIDLLAVENGGRALACNDEHYGSMHNLNLPGRGINMGDGWETRRRREPGNDWVILTLGHTGVVERIEIDTAHFKGNYPDRASIQAARVNGGGIDKLVAQSEGWDLLLPESKLEMDVEHQFQEQVREIGAINHVRLNIFPDGGVSRLRLFGRISR
ncbi:MAG: allantoicase, partial [Gammaproteobacteria bacterium]|nr:allantoicase [Gammaproteobacteria bacterium]